MASTIILRSSPVCGTGDTQKNKSGGCVWQKWAFELVRGAGSTPSKSIVGSWSPELVVSSGCCSPSEPVDAGAGVDRVVVGGVTRRNLRNSVGVLKLVAAVVHGDVPLRNSRYSAIWEAFWARSPRPMDCDRGRSEVMTPGKVHDF